jgi:hypothetical protein
MASFREEIANCGLREKENGQLWPILEKSQLWARRRKMGNCGLFWEGQLWPLLRRESQLWAEKERESQLWAKGREEVASWASFFLVGNLGLFCEHLRPLLWAFLASFDFFFLQKNIIFSDYINWDKDNLHPITKQKHNWNLNQNILFLNQNRNICWIKSKPIAKHVFSSSTCKLTVQQKLLVRRLTCKRWNGVWRRYWARRREMASELG